jgi:serine/threonine protein kinase
MDPSVSKNDLKTAQRDEDMPLLEEGQELGAYRLVRVLGKGGMGQVWLAHDPAMDRHVAIKVLATELTNDGEFLKRFQQEAKLSGQIQHKHVITAYEAGVVDDTPYLVMEYVKGQELEDVILESGPIPEKKALRIVRQIADALQNVWDEYKILHRDIKPSNIMVDEEGHAYLMDLGVSKSMKKDAHITMTGMVVGTPNYMSPEQARGAEIDFRADAYSLGVTLYHMLTGTPPFEAENSIQVLSRVITEDLPDLNDCGQPVSPSCQSLVRRMAAKDRDDRYGDWDELKQDIVRTIKGKPVGQRREVHNPYASADVKKASTSEDATETDSAEPSLAPLLWSLALIVLIIVLGAAVYVVTWKSKTPTPSVTAPK